MSDYQYRQLGSFPLEISPESDYSLFNLLLANTFAFNECEWVRHWVNEYVHKSSNASNCEQSMKHSVCAQITNKEFINRLNFHYLVYLKYSCLYTPYTLGVQDKLECHWCFHDGSGGSHSLKKREAVLSISLCKHRNCPGIW